MDLTSLLFSFNGRLNRGKYWFAAAVYIAVWAAFAVVTIFVLRELDKDEPFSFAGTGIALWLGGALLVLASIWSGLATAIKRLHDRDKSGWWILLFWFAPSVLSGARSVTHGGVGLLLALASIGISIWALVELGLLPGTRGENPYGPDPLEPRY